MRNGKTQYIYCRVLILLLAGLGSATVYDDFIAVTGFYRSYGTVLIEGSQAGNYPKGRYIVLGRLSVDRGTTMEIASGSVVYLAGDAHIVVDGELIANGVDFKPLPAELYYIADNGDAAVSRTARPWRGILVGPNGTINISRSKIYGSSYGVYSFFPTTSLKMVLDSVCFVDNIHYNVYSMDKYIRPTNICMGVNDTIPYVKVSNLLAPTSNLTACGRTQELKRLIIPTAATLIFAGLFTYDMVQHNQYFKKYKTANADMVGEYRRSAENAATQAMIHGALGLVSLGITGWIGYTILF